MVKKYRVRIINYDKTRGGYRAGATAWINDSITEDINEAFVIRQQKQNASSRIEYKYVVEEWKKGMV